MPFPLSINFPKLQFSSFSSLIVGSNSFIFLVLLQNETVIFIFCFYYCCCGETKRRPEYEQLDKTDEEESPLELTNEMEELNKIANSFKNKKNKGNDKSSNKVKVRLKQNENSPEVVIETNDMDIN